MRHVLSLGDGVFCFVVLFCLFIRNALYNAVGGAKWDACFLTVETVEQPYTARVFAVFYTLTGLSSV